jgi:hypothetical protein
MVFVLFLTRDGRDERDGKDRRAAVPYVIYVPLVLVCGNTADLK